MSDKPLIKFGSSELKSLLIAKYLMTDNHVEIVDCNKSFSFDNSFIFEEKSFDVGCHIVDVGRSPVYTDILTSLDIEWFKSPSTRSLVFNGKKFKRGYDFAEIQGDFSSENRKVFQSEFLTKLEAIYGSDFIKFSIENIAKSYVQNELWIEDNLSAEIILTNIYPWFFPLTPEDPQGSLNKTRPHFHNHMIEDNVVMYPKEGSFMAITHAARKAVKELISEADDSSYQVAVFDSDGKIDVEENTYHVLPIDYIDVASRFNLEFPDYTETHFYLISVVLDNPINFDEHEILVGDTDYYVDRVSTPDSFSGKDEITSLQFECETLFHTDEYKLIENIKSFTAKFLENASWDKYDIKATKLKRYNTQGIDEKINKILDFVESKNPQVIVLNRHIAYNNLTGSVENLITRINRVIQL